MSDDLSKLLADVKRAREHIDEALAVCNTGGLSAWELRQVVGFCLTQAINALTGDLPADELERIGRALDAMHEGAASAGVTLRTPLERDNVDGQS